MCITLLISGVLLLLVVIIDILCSARQQGKRIEEYDLPTFLWGKG